MNFKCSAHVKLKTFFSPFTIIRVISRRFLVINYKSCTWGMLFKKNLTFYSWLSKFHFVFETNIINLCRQTDKKKNLISGEEGDNKSFFSWKEDIMIKLETFGLNCEGETELNAQ